MKTALLALILGSPLALAAESSFECTCSTSDCRVTSTVRVTYDKATQFMRAETAAWEVSGYAARLHSKRTEKTYLVLPQGYAGQRFVVTIDKGGVLTLDDTGMSCRLLGERP